MSVHDPSLSCLNAFRGDAVQSGAVPTLYHAQGSYGSQLARLALRELGVAFRSRLVDPNVDPHTAWFLKLNPAGTLPVLVRTPHEGAPEEVVAGAAAVCEWAASHYPTVSLAPPPGSPAEATLRRLLTLHAAFDEEDAAWVFADTLSRTVLLPQRLRCATARLASLVSDQSLDVSVREAAAQQNAACVSRRECWGDEEALRQGVTQAVTALLDGLEESLCSCGGGQFCAGERYSLADVHMTVFLANLRCPGQDPTDVHARRQTALYLGRMRLRPSFADADVWEGPRPGRAFSLLGSALLTPLLLLGSEVSTRVVRPVAATSAYKRCAEVLVDAHNSVSVPFQEDVKPALQDAVQAYLVRPASAAAMQMQTHVVRPVANAAHKLHTDFRESAPFAAVSAAYHDKLLPAVTPTLRAVEDTCDVYITPIATAALDVAVVRVA